MVHAIQRPNWPACSVPNIAAAQGSTAWLSPPSISTRSSALLTSTTQDMSVSSQHRMSLAICHSDTNETKR
ncbi:Alpha-amylase [Clarias magur]|uniref:Alpha-amylase n=1 Tax=Clarias magur TaxID=1594786 RepID=A0A8J4U9X5_CLAMG|nr:Alpha-amylase [Clarias magur]